MECLDLLRRYFGGSETELLIGGLPVSAIADRYGTPLFIYDASVLQRKYDLLRQSLPPEISICYSVKANPNQTLLRLFLTQGVYGLEVASVGEFLQARAADCPPEKILFAGPGKTENELRLVLEQHIGEIHAESVTEIERIAAIARSLNFCAPVALRVNPAADSQGGAMRMGGKPAPFGVDEETLDSALDLLLAHSSIEFRGLHLFSGTQILDYQILLTQYRKALELATRVAVRVGKPLHTVDFGGGLGVPYFSHEQELDMDALRGGLAELFREVRSQSQFSGTGFVVEPGRYLVAEAGIYVCRINDIKTSRGKKFLILDGGMHHHLAASGNLGQTIKRNYPVAVLNRLDQSPSETVDLVGPLCTPLDVLARGVQLPAAQIGDLIGIFQSGAYARSASPLGFLSHRTPAEVLVENGCARLARQPGTEDDYFRDQCLSAEARV